jgi:hypothetical protein
LVKAHLIRRQVMEKEGHADRVWDPGAWVWACGGPMGNAGHHGMLDHSRTLRIHLTELPVETIELAIELGLDWWLDREYDRG